MNPDTQTGGVQDFQFNFFRQRRMGKHVLLTTDHGGWILISEAEYLRMLHHRPSPQLYNALLSKGIIVTESNIKTVIDQYKKKYQFFYGGTALHLIVSTTRCNHCCVYCHSNVSKPLLLEETMDNKTADKVLDFIFQSPSSHIIIEFQGGESLLAFDVVKYVVDKATAINTEKKKKLDFVIVTNLTLLKEEMIDFMATNNIRVSTSLDGPEHVHNINRKFVGGGDTYDTVINMMERLKEKKVPVGMLMVTTRYSLPYWKEIIDEYVNLGQSNIRLKFLDYLGYAINVWNRIGYSVEEYLDFWKKSADYIFSLNQKGVVIVESNIDLVLRKLHMESDPNFLDLRSPCGIVTGQLAYNYNGDIISCDEGRSDGYYVLGNVKENDYADILRSTKVSELVSSSINENFLCDACVYKPFCGLCPVLSRSEQKSLITSPPKDNHCKIFKFYFDYVFDKILNEPALLKKSLLGIKLTGLLNASLEKVCLRD